MAGGAAAAPPPQRPYHYARRSGGGPPVTAHEVCLIVGETYDEAGPNARLPGLPPGWEAYPRVQRPQVGDACTCAGAGPCVVGAAFGWTWVGPARCGDEQQHGDAPQVYHAWHPAART